ncbi:MAG TPA: peptidylprolyl isomerase [Chloroflexia bacterium]|jgi:parvulin-like peptidyl-prolyl isomerase
MAKKKKLQSQAPVPLTRGQLSRAQQEQRKIRNLYATAVVVGTLVVLVVALAVVSTFILRPNQTVGRVNLIEDHTINRATYDKARRYSLWQTMQQNALTRQLSQSTTALEDTQNEQLQFRNVSNETTLDEQTVVGLVNAELLRQGAKRDYQIDPNNEALKTYVLKQFEPQPTPPATPEPSAAAASPTVAITATQTTTPTITPSPTRTPTAGSPTSTPTATATYPPVPGAEQTAVASYGQYVSALDMGVEPSTTNGYCQLGCPDLSEDDYLNLIVKPNYLREKVQEVQASQIMTQVEQIHAQHILTTTKEGAEKLRQQLLSGADFTTLANTESSEQLDAIAQGRLPNGGDLGWFPRENSGLIKEFVEGAWPVQVGQVSGPVQTSFGWHIIKVLERNPKRELSADIIAQVKTKTYDDWFAKIVSEASVIEPKPTPTPAPPTAGVIEPTTPPIAPSPQVTTTVTVTGTQTTLPATTPAAGTPTTGTGTTPAAGTPTVAATTAVTGTANTPVATGTAGGTAQVTATVAAARTAQTTSTVTGATPTP